MTTKHQPRHRAGDPPHRLEDLLSDNWHIGRSWPGMAPVIETNCPCPQAPCGLVTPRADIDCDQHRGGKPLRQGHPADKCRRSRLLFWMKP